MQVFSKICDKNSNIVSNDGRRHSSHKPMIQMIIKFVELRNMNEVFHSEMYFQIKYCLKYRVYYLFQKCFFKCNNREK